MDESKKKITIVTICSLILVAMVVALVATGHNGDEPEEAPPNVLSPQKAITAICDTTDYKQTCVRSLEASGTNSTDPEELIRVAFQATKKYITEAAQNSTTLRELEKDPKGKDALETCRELARRAENDLQRSFAKFNTFDINTVDDILVDLRIWLSGAITNQETCLDAFNDVSGEAGLKMQEALKTGMQMTSNALAMVQELLTFLEEMGLQNFKSRRLLAADVAPAVFRHGSKLPGWMDFNDRKMLAEMPQKIRVDLVVAKDGSGKYATINEALKVVPKNRNKTFVLHIKEGVYNEIVKINSSSTNLMILGDGPTKTRITGNLNFMDGVSTYHTATVAVQGDNFMARDIGIENSAGPHKHQAVALRVSADKAVFFNCQFDGYQDTLYVHTYRQFYRDCVISGTVDFVFGDSAAVFQGCTFFIRKPMENQQCIVTAQGRKEVRQPTALVLQNCTITADKDYFPAAPKVKSYLGRPWKEFSRTIIMESFIDSVIEPQGWLPWNETFAMETLFYTEFNNRGPAAPKGMRVKWPGVKELQPERIQRFTAAEFLDGNKWVPRTRVPYARGFIFSVPKKDPNVKYSPVSQEENMDLGQVSDRESKSDGGHSSQGNHGSGSPVNSPTSSPPSESGSDWTNLLNSWMKPHEASPAPAPQSTQSANPQPSELGSEWTNLLNSWMKPHEAPPALAPAWQSTQSANAPPSESGSVWTNLLNSWMKPHEAPPAPAWQSTQSANPPPSESGSDWTNLLNSWMKPHEAAPAPAPAPESTQNVNPPPSPMASGIPAPPPIWMGAAPSGSPATVPSSSPVAAPTGSLAPSPSGSPASSPAASPITSPAMSPSGSSISSPAVSPIGSPALSPRGSPVRSPTASPIGSPALSPSDSPVSSPAASPIDSPASSPAGSPIGSPVATPTGSPAAAPSGSPAAAPSGIPAASPMISNIESP